jgi:glycosyltransferase involved in cell wall biosynthesis
VRVLLVTNMYPTAKAPHSGTFVAEQVESVRRLGIEVDVVHVDRLEGGRRAYRGLGPAVRSRAASTAAELVHVAYGGLMAEAVTRAVRDAPVMLTFHGSDLLGHPGGGLQALSPRVGVSASRLAARRADGIIVVSERLRDALPRSVDPARVWLVPNGVDLNRFRPLDRRRCRQTLGWREGDYHVVFPSSPARPEKRFALARAATAQVSAGRPVQLHALDGVAHADVPIWLNAADAVLLTSTHEGSPVVLKEALACDTPVVSVDVGDVRERLEGVAGCHIAGATADQLVKGLAVVLADGGRIDGRGRVEELGLDRIGRRIADVYRAVARGAAANQAA